MKRDTVPGSLASACSCINWPGPWASTITVYHTHTLPPQTVSETSECRFKRRRLITLRKIQDYLTSTVIGKSTVDYRPQYQTNHQFDYKLQHGFCYPNNNSRLMGVQTRRARNEPSKSVRPSVMLPRFADFPLELEFPSNSYKYSYLNKISIGGRGRSRYLI